MPLIVRDATPADVPAIAALYADEVRHRVNTYEYDVPDVPHAMRLTTTGTYIHGNYWGNAFGKSNASHGCVGLKDVKGGSSSSSAGAFFNSSLIGDVVKIVNSTGRTVGADNGLSGWTLPWSNW